MDSSYDTADLKCPFCLNPIADSKKTAPLKSMIFKSAAELFAQTPSLSVFPIDIPIGLTDSVPRQCG
jgi:hypothetical protein